MRVAMLATALVVCVGNVGGAQRPSRTTAAPIGTYAIGTTVPPQTRADGCWLETAPATAELMRLQILCRYPAPGHHLGVLDARLRLRGDSLVYERHEGRDACRILVRFANGGADVVQHGSDIACGFGAGVNVGGTYARISTRRPPFDLAPIERAAKRGG
jgi:hypothetical protein